MFISYLLTIPSVTSLLPLLSFLLMCFLQQFFQDLEVQTVWIRRIKNVSVSPSNVKDALARYRTVGCLVSTNILKIVFHSPIAF